MRTTSLAPAVFILLLGCNPSQEQDPNRPLQGVQRAEQSIAKPMAPSDARPAALVQGAPIASPDLNARLAEAAGSVVLEELALGRLLDKLILDSGIVVTQGDIDAEQEVLAQTVTQEAKLTPAQAQGAINELRRNRGLGPVRFADMLARNAKMRALVRREVEVSAAEIDQALAVEFGPTLRIRMLTAQTEVRLSEIRDEITRGVSPLMGGDSRATPADAMANPTRFAPADLPTVTTRFSQAAVEASTDPSSARGGLVTAVSPLDPGLPPSLQNTLRIMRPGDLSPILAVDKGYMIVLVESRTESARTPTPADRLVAESRVRLRKERIAMDRLARQQLGAAQVSPLDASLRWSWDSRPKP